MADASLLQQTTEASQGWSDQVGIWLSNHVGNALSGLKPMMSPGFFDSFVSTLSTFIFIFAELTVLFVLISFFIGILQQYIPPEKIKDYLGNRRSYLLAALLGAVTPFCSCSTIPFLKGLIRARVKFGGIVVFLLASPLLNPIIIGLFVIAFGWKIAVYYFVVAMVFSILAGLLLEKLGFERYVIPVDSANATEAPNSCCEQNASEKVLMAGSCCEPEPPAVSSCCSEPVVVNDNCCDSLAQPITASCCGESDASDTGCCDAPVVITGEKSVNEKIKAAWWTTKADFIQAFPYMLIGVAIGAMIYGFIPSDLITQFAGQDSIFAVPIAAVIGIPLYLRAEAVIPISLGLVGKGMGMGAVMALIIGSAGASLTELILLRALFKRQIIIAFVFVVVFMAIASGYMMPLIF
jgi:uncharacterized membrane protein YraQ (UPF0718 family)